MNSVPTPPPPPIVQVYPKWTIVVAYLLCPVLLGLSAYGFMEWFQIPTMRHLMEREELFYLISLVVIPLVLFLFLMVTTAQKTEHNRITTGYQLRLDHLQN